MKRKSKVAVVESVGLNLKDNSEPIKTVEFECPKNHRAFMPSNISPRCSLCNYTRPMKPRVVCPKCEGLGRASTNNPKKCITCWGEGTVSPEFTKEEKQ